jgi:hypothetical protein
VLFRLYPGVKVKFLGEDEVVEDDIATWKADRKERIRA